ncbi:MAG: VWA domain-containing protein, partial [Salinibacterium sp.]|nr:VWA domain-containing protein [Salinibacterium sp.]
MLASLLDQLDAFGVPTVEFASPAYLLLAPFLWLISLWISLGALGGWRGGKQAAQLTLRIVVFTILCVALAEPNVRWSAEDVAVVVVRDMSDSVPVDEHGRATDFISASLQHKPPNDRIGLVTAASDAVVQTLPTSIGELQDADHFGQTGQTNLEQAVRLAISLAPTDAGGRVLLISDGNETIGSLERAIDAAKTAGVPIDVATTEYDRSRLIKIRNVVVPSWTRENETIDVKVILDAGRPTRGRLNVTVNGRAVDLDPESPDLSLRADLNRGVNVFTASVQLADDPVYQVEATFEPDDAVSGMDVAGLLRSSAVTFTSAPGRVLV